MFEDSLIESGGVLKTKRSATTAASLILQSALVAAFAGFSLLYTQTLPERWATARIGPLPPASAPAAAAGERRAVRPVESDMIGQKLREPREIPKNIAQIRESQAPLPAVPSQELGIPGGTGDPASGNLLTSIMNLTPAAAIPKPAISGPMRVSQGVERGFLVHEVKPVYPPLARQARIQGVVLLQAIIGKDGTIEGLRVVSGHPLLAPAAIEAVRQWRYRPYTLNGSPVQVETEITVNFVLAGG